MKVILGKVQVPHQPQAQSVQLDRQEVHITLLKVLQEAQVHHHQHAQQAQLVLQEVFLSAHLRKAV